MNNYCGIIYKHSERENFIGISIKRGPISKYQAIFINNWHTHRTRINNWHNNWSFIFYIHYYYYYLYICIMYVYIYSEQYDGDGVYNLTCNNNLFYPDSISRCRPWAPFYPRQDPISYLTNAIVNKTIIFWFFIIV